MNHQTINWQKVYAITLLNSAIVICWMAYHFFQPKILSQFGLEAAANTVNSGKAIVLVVVPPIAGFIADVLARKLGKNYLVFTIGVSLTALIFMASAYVFLDVAPDQLKSYIPLFMVLWLISMNIFYSPATGFILSAAGPKDIAWAIAMIVVVTNLLFAVLPYLMMVLELIGSSLTFVVGALLLVIASIYYFRVAKKDEAPEQATSTEVKNSFFIPFWVGLATGLIKVLTLVEFGNVTNTLFPAFDLITLIFIAAALLAFPLCWWLEKSPWSYSFNISFFISLIVLLVAWIFPNWTTAIIAIIVLSASTAVVAVASFPYVITSVNKKQENLAVGIFLGAFSLPMSVWPFL
jgi:MFS family permease